MNEKVKKFINYLIAFMFGFVLAGGIAIGYCIHRSRLNRIENGQLESQLELTSNELAAVRGELATVREELVAATNRLSEYTNQIDSIRIEIGNCQSIVADSLGLVQDIRDATQRIRRQIEILQDYYNRIGNIYSSLYDMADNTSGEWEIK